VIFLRKKEEDPFFSFVNLDNLARTHLDKLKKGMKLQVPAKGKKLIIDKYDARDGIVEMDVLENTGRDLAKTSYKLEKRFVGVDPSTFSGFREMLTVNHTLVDSRAKVLTVKNTKIDLSKGKVVEVKVEEIKETENKDAFQEKSGYLRGYFIELENTEKSEKKITGHGGLKAFFSGIFKKPEVPDFNYRDKFEKIIEKASKYRSRLEQGDNIEFKISHDTTIIIDEYKPDLKLTELRVLEKRAGRISKIDYKMEKEYAGMTSGFGDTCFSKALLTVNHTLLNTRDQSVNLRETRVDCLGGHVKDVFERDIRRNVDTEDYRKYASYIRGYQFELTSEDEIRKKKNVFNKLFRLEDRAKLKKHIKEYDEIKQVIKKRAFPEDNIIDISPHEKLLIEKKSDDNMPEVFQVVARDTRGIRKTEYEVHRHYLGGSLLGQDGFIQVLSVNTTLLDTRSQVITFSDSTIDLDHSLLLENQSMEHRLVHHNQQINSH